MQGLSIDLLLPEPFRLSEIQHRRRFVDSSDAYRTKGISRLKGLRSDGREIDVEGTVSHVKVEQDQLLMYILRDVTRRVLDEAEREQSRTQLSSLANKLMLQEKELIKVALEVPARLRTIRWPVMRRKLRPDLRIVSI